MRLLENFIDEPLLRETFENNNINYKDSIFAEILLPGEFQAIKIYFAKQGSNNNSNENTKEKTNDKTKTKSCENECDDENESKKKDIVTPAFSQEYCTYLSDNKNNAEMYKFIKYQSYVELYILHFILCVIFIHYDCIAVS